MMNHEHEHARQIVHRISRAIGHMEAVKKMVAEGRDCSEVLVQIAAIKAAVNNIGKQVLQDHIDHCIVHAVESGDQKTIADLHLAIDKFMK